MKLDGIDKIRIRIYDSEKKGIGYIVDGEKKVSVYYIIDDEKIIHELVKHIKDVKIYGAFEKVWENYEKRCDWGIDFYMNDKEYKMELNGGNIENKSAEGIYIGTGYVENEGRTSKEFPDLEAYMLATSNLTYNQNLDDYICDFVKKYIRNITVEEILDIHTEGIMEKFLGYENDGGRDPKDYSITSNELYTNLYTLPIEDFDGYIVLEKENECIDYADGSSDVYKDIIDVKIYKNTGESIDFMNSTREQVEEFLECAN